MLGTMDERMTILKMVEENKISAEQGAQLLGALGKPGETVPLEPAEVENPGTVGEGESEQPEAAPKVETRGRWFRVLISDTVTGKTRTSVKIPLGMVYWGLRVGSKYNARVAGIDLEELGQLLEAGEDGQIIEVIDEEDGEHVQIFVE